MVEVKKLHCEEHLTTLLKSHYLIHKDKQAIRWALNELQLLRKEIRRLNDKAPQPEA